ncbi:MAG: beta-glucosidase, partial [Balneolaceae bacterium]
MQNFSFFRRSLLAVTLLFFISCEPDVPRDIAADSVISAETRERVDLLLAEMTLEEKVGQMTQITLDVIGKGDDVFGSYEPFELDPEMMREAFQTYHIGSVMNSTNNRARTPEFWNEVIVELQDYVMEHHRLDIPLIYGIDMIHGASYIDGATLFPQQIGMAATWNPELVRRSGEITAYETRATGLTWTFSPVVDLGVDPRWPRHWETFGEDPYLASVLAHELIKGYEGEDNDIGSPYHIASCPKHVFGYSHTLSGRDRTPAWIPESQLREYHLPPVKAAIDAGALNVMMNSGEINGIPFHA